MKKLYLIFLMLLILFIPTTQAVTINQLDQPITELDGYTLREVFQNRNLAMPDLTNATDLGGGNYRLYNDNVITIDYNIYNGYYVVNGVVVETVFTNTYQFLNSNIIGVSNIKPYLIQDNSTYSSEPNVRFYYENHTTSTVLSLKSNVNLVSSGLNISNIYFAFYSGTYNNFTFKLQLEKGSQATPYQVPTNGPYSEIDLGQFNLTPEQIQTYYDLYLDLSNVDDPQHAMSFEFFMVSTFFIYVLIMAIGYFTKVKYCYLAGALLWFVPIFNYENLFIITTSVIVFILHLMIIFFSDKDDAFE